VFFVLLFLVVAAARLCHVHILWAEEDLPAAAAVQMLRGKTLYRDVWFDKPPLVPSVYVLWGADTGVPLRIAGALFVLLCCWLAYRFAKEMWSEREGFTAAALLGFFLTFGLPSAVMALAADLLMLAPHIAAVYLAWKGRPLLSGAAAGIAFLFNPKALFVVAACLLWQYRSAAWFALGFAAPNAAALLALAAHTAVGHYYEQVWRLGSLYARDTFLEDPVLDRLVRTANWMGFHAALVAGAAWFWWKDDKSDRARLAGWAALSLAAVAAGWRFFPRYYFQLLPVMTLAAARGCVLLGRKRALVLLLLLVPLVRFGPRYVLLARDLVRGAPHEWGDVAMDRDSRDAASLILEHARPADTLFVWGYRPDIFVYTRMRAGARFLESQPLTGVFADRHLVDSGATLSAWAAQNRQELARARPTFVVDGLSAFNPRLAIGSYPELRHWLDDYDRTGGTRFTSVYKLRSTLLAHPAR
jgi:hypothetical protein